MNQLFFEGGMRPANTAQRQAVIDVGTNSVKLLVADVGFTVEPVLKLSRQTRLGQGAFDTRRLRPDAIVRTANGVAEFAAKAAKLGSTSIRVLATSAAREAANGHKLVQAIRRATGLNVEIISGDQEAAYVFRGVTSELELASRPVMIVDVGGGSTEWVVGEGGFTYFSRSTKIGTTRLLETLSPGDPPTPADLARCRAVVADFLRREVRPSLRPVLAAFCGRAVSLVGLGGAIKTLANMAAAQDSSASGPLRLELAALRAQVKYLWQLSCRERRSLPGLDPQKADVILAGAVLYEAAMVELGFSEMRISNRGLRHGALLSGLAPVSHSIPVQSHMLEHFPDIIGSRYHDRSRRLVPPGMKTSHEPQPTSK